MVEISRQTGISIGAGLFLLFGILAYVMIPVAFPADTIILTNPQGGAPVSCLPSGGFVLAQNLTDLCDVTIVSPATNQILQYNGSQWVNVMGAGFVDTTTCTNVGTGTAYVCIEGTNVDLRSLLAGAGISVANNTNTITITNTSPEATVCTNLGVGGEGVYASGNCDFKKLLAGSGITLSSDATHIMINATGSGDTTVCGNVGTGIDIHVETSNCDARSLIAGTGISIVDTTDDLTITNTAPDNTACFNVGTGLGVYNSLECSFNTLIAGTGITITDTTDDLTFESQCANTGTGEAVCESSNNINSLIAGTGITIVDTTGDLTITNTVTDTDDLIGQMSAYVSALQTKTNIGGSYVDIYAGVLIPEHLVSIDCSLVTDVRAVYIWDYVGSGTQQIRWVDSADDANVLIEVTGIVSDADAGDSGWITKPAWCTGITFIQMQGLSSVATDDPATRGYVLYSR